MERKIINPWSWQDRFGFVQANQVSGATKTLHCAGQISVDDEGRLVHHDDMMKQVEQIVKNLETIFAQSELELSDIVRITYYTTDIPAFTQANLNYFSNKLAQWGAKPATTLIGVAALARPECLVELEVTAEV